MKSSAAEMHNIATVQHVRPMFLTVARPCSIRHVFPRVPVRVSAALPERIV